MLRRYWLELAWLLFAAANLAVITLAEEWETIPFHFVWLSFSIVYAVQLWRLRTTMILLGVVCVTSGIALTWAVLDSGAGIDETSEVPLMGAIFLAMVWHAARRQAAVDAGRRAAQRQRQLERERDRVRDASHELRTPITIARGHAELIRETHANEDVAADVQVIIDELGRLEKISDRLLILAAADHSAFLHFGKVDFERLIESTARRWRAAAPRRWHARTEEGGTLLADPERLEATLDALIENAVKSTAEGDAIAIVGRAERDEAIIEIMDTGQGIAAADLPRIFDRFTRVDGSRSNGDEGTGLGLAIVKAITDAHGGTVEVDSKLGGGTMFRVRLPGFRPLGVPERDPSTSELALPGGSVTSRLGQPRG